MWLQLLVCCVLAAASPDQLSFEDYFLEGKRSYTEGDWQQCVAFMRKAIEDFRFLEDELLFCRRKCSQQVELPEEHFISQWHFDAERALCVLRCRRERLTGLHPGIRKMNTYFDMKERKPFEYLHICHWRTGDLTKAVGAAFTFVVSNPGHPDVLHALKFYMTQPGFKEEMLVDEIALRHEKSYMNGVLAYQDGDWNKCVFDFEGAVEKILEEERSCRHSCEDKIDWSGVEGNPEITVLLTSIRLSTVRCTQSCLLRLGVINGHNVGNPLASVFEYLHVCYFNLMRGGDAMRTVANYLLFDDNPSMRRNKYFYLNHYEKPELFVPDMNIAEFHKQRVFEQRFMDFVTDRFRYEEDEFPRETSEDRKRVSLEVWIQDDFSYSSVESLLLPEECRLLRAPFGPSPSQMAFLAELRKRVLPLFPTASNGSLDCGAVRDANCSKAFVLSSEESTCGQWLGQRYSGCSVVFCT